MKFDSSDLVLPHSVIAIYKMTVIQSFDHLKDFQDLHFPRCSCRLLYILISGYFIYIIDTRIVLSATTEKCWSKHLSKERNPKTFIQYYLIIQLNLKKK